MWKSYKIDLDAEDFFKGLDLVKKDMNKIARRMMSKVSGAIRKDVRDKNLKGGVLKKQEGLLLKSIKYKAKTDFTATISSGTSYSSTHEMGKSILPKNKKYLTFQVDGEWKKVRNINIPQRQFLWPVIDEYFQTKKAEKIMDDVLDEALKQIFEER